MAADTQLRWQLVCTMAFALATFVVSVLIYATLLRLEAASMMPPPATPAPPAMMDVLEVFRKRAAASAP